MDLERVYEREREKILRNLDKSSLALEEMKEPLLEAARLIRKALSSGGKLLLFGNGGSAADAQHWAAEFVGRYAEKRKGLPAVALTTDTSALTAIANDFGFDEVFARQVEALGRPGDVAVGISTSGNSPNVVAALRRARELGCATIAVLGRDGGQTAGLCDVSLVYGAEETPRIQEFHAVIGHLLCSLSEAD